jgi:hypothetical protein
VIHAVENQTWRSQSETMFRVETCVYRGCVIMVRHSGDSPNHVHVGYVDGVHQFNDENFPNLVRRLGQRVDALRVVRYLETKIK